MSEPLATLGQQRQRACIERMSANTFGRRYIRQSDFLSYAQYLGLGSFLQYRLEFAERIGILTPAARVRYPDSVVRRWHVDQYKGDEVTNEIEPDGPVLDAAESLWDTLVREMSHPMKFIGTWHHPLDAVTRVHRPFVTKRFAKGTFTPWSDLRTLIERPNGRGFYDRDGVVTYYHAWQVFLFAAFLRSGMTVLHDVFDPDAMRSPLDLQRSDLHISGGSYLELKTLRDNAGHFDAVAQFCALTNRAFQVYARDRVPNSMRLTEAASDSYRAAENAIARRVVKRAQLKPLDLIKFIQLQCTLWDDAQSRHPPRIVDEYKRNVWKTIELLRLAYPRNSRRAIMKRVGAVNGWHRHALDVMFPDWLAEQRQSVEPSLQQWIVPRLAQMPPTFAFSATDVTSFCNWIEHEGFLQLYWHFRRLTDIGPFDDQIGRTAATTEIVGLASLIEHLVTHILAKRKPRPNQVILRSDLAKKVVELLGANHAPLRQHFEKYANLRQTKKLPLRRQLTRIERARFAGPSAPALKALLRLVLIRNAVSHAGLQGFNREEMHSLVESLLVAALVVWKAR